MTVTIEDHVKDMEGLLDTLDIKKAAIVAHAFGGFVAMRFAVDHPERISAVVVTCTAAKVSGRTKKLAPHWIEIIEKIGEEPLLDESMERWFVESFRQEHPDVIQLYRDMVAANPPTGYAANFRGVLQYDITSELHKIKCPTLVVAGAEDKSLPVSDHELLAQNTHF